MHFADCVVLQPVISFTWTHKHTKFCLYFSSLRFYWHFFFEILLQRLTTTAAAVTPTTIYRQKCSKFSFLLDFTGCQLELLLYDQLLLFLFPLLSLFLFWKVKFIKFIAATCHRLQQKHWKHMSFKSPK